MEVTGKLVKILDLEEGTSKAGKSWQKQCIIVEQSLPTGVEYGKEVVITFFGDKIKQLRDVELGDIQVSVNLSSREFNGKYYHNIDGYWITQSMTQRDLGDENSPF